MTVPDFRIRMNLLRQLHHRPTPGIRTISGLSSGQSHCRSVYQREYFNHGYVLLCGLYLHHTISGESLLEDMNEKVRYATKKPRYIVEMCRALEGVVSEVRSGADWQGDRSGCSFAVFPDDRCNHSILAERDEVQDLEQKCLHIEKRC